MVLFEREAELQHLETMLDEARTGTGSVVLVTAGAGIGKSALLRDFCARVEPTRVLWGACDPLSTPRPFGPFVELSDQLGSVAERLGEPESVARYLEPMFSALRVQPTILVIDDCQWADEASVDLLRFFVRRIEATSCLLVPICRDGEITVGHPLRLLLGDIARSERATTMRLQPLSPEAVAAITEGTGLDPHRVHELTGGNSFFVTEIAAHASESLPPTVRDAVLARATELDPVAYETLELIACSPEGIPDVLLPVLQIDLPALRQIDATGLITRTDRRLTFNHELARIAIQDSIPPGGEIHLHQRVLDAMELAEMTDAIVGTHHAVGARDHLRAHGYAIEAARQATAAGAHTEAASFLQIALDHMGPDSPSLRADLHQMLASELYMTSRLQDALDSISTTIAIREELGEPVALAIARQHRAVFEFYNADMNAAHDQVELAMSATERDGPNIGLGLAHATAAYLALHQSDLVAAESHASRARDVADEIGSLSLRIRSSMIESAALLASGQTAQREVLVDLIRETHDQSIDDELTSTGFSNLASLDVEQCRLHEAEEVLQTSLPFAAERDIPICNAWQLGIRARLHLLRGRWEAAVEDANEVITTGGLPMADLWPHLVLGLVAIRRGEPSDGHLDEAWRLAWQLEEPQLELHAGTALAEQMWLTGESDDRVVDALALVDRIGGTAGLEWALGEHAVWLSRLDHEPGLAFESGPHRLYLAGDIRKAAQWWEQAQMPYEQALALTESPDSSDCSAGVELLDLLGATPVADRCRRDLRARGISDIPVRPRGSTRANPGGLTNRQLEVARLVAEGLTNAELAEKLYISPKTADHHVSAVLAKLGVPNRHAVAGAIAELGAGITDNRATS